eukprot:TRINITY_DN8585_c0_g1_i1.p1 TRINITY_DN8585_c0_g1~~TRINITY_DN8585_c0_g1_i1.p1  ORF type:complete len:155 (+),score=27.28 TRINITY_DN8585_c0_g1_i1:67-531(+)
MVYRAGKKHKPHNHNRKLRGHISHGHGRIGKARKHASGRGNAGGQHHHRIMMDKYHPGYFGKVGMRNYRFKKCAQWMPTIGADKLTSLLTKKEQDIPKDSELVPVIDLVAQHGIFKVLGRGKGPRRAIIVKARSFSKLAEKKIKKAGGACVIVP